VPNRIIKESIVTSDNLNELSPEEEVFFYRLMVVCDDYGRMDARPQIILAKCYPLKTSLIKIEKIVKWMDALRQQELLKIYEVDGKQYLYMTTWDKHQQKRAKKSKYPEPPEFEDNNINLQSSDIKCNQAQANVPEKRETRNEKRESDAENKKPALAPKKKFADLVFMTEAEYDKLVEECGAEDTAKLIDMLNTYKESSGRKYKSDYHAIKKWVISALAEEKQKVNKAGQNKARAPSESQSPAAILAGGEYKIYIPPPKGG
jgi:hypothetical protein